MRSEKALEKRLGEDVKAVGGLSIKMPATYFAGLPDRVCLFPEGVCVFAEVKTAGKKPTKLQNLVHKKIRALGFHVYIIDSLSSLETLLNDVERIRFT